MRKTFTALFALAFASVLMLDDAYAARLGGGRGVGIQRTAPMPRRAVPPAATPQQAKQAAPATQPAQPAGNRWFGPLAGLAAGLGLGWLLGQGGLSGFGGVLLIALLAVAAVAILSRLFNRTGQPLRRMSYADFGGSERAAAIPEQVPEAASGPDPIAGGACAPSHGPAIPAGFDAAAFLKHAEQNFVRLQEANDGADLAVLREVTTGEMFESLKNELASRGARQQRTEVVALNAELLDVATEADMHWASVRFSGSVREAPSAAAEPFDEIWHLQKPVDGRTGWLLAGIQQPQAS